jgi:hypothetical protein
MKNGLEIKNGKICNIPVSEGELTIIRAAQAAEIMKHSCEVAKAARAAGAGVLIINTGLSKRRFKAAAADVGIELSPVRDTSSMVSPGNTSLIIQTSIAGELSSQLSEIRQICEEAKIRIVIITGWEWTSASHRRKELLLFGLRGLLDELDISLIVYTQSPNSIASGKYARGGVGKLAMIAYEVVDYLPEDTRDAETDLGELVGVPKPQPVVVGGEQLSARKINELQGNFATSPLSPLLSTERVFARAA